MTLSFAFSVEEKKKINYGEKIKKENSQIFWMYCSSPILASCDCFLARKCFVLWTDHGHDVSQIRSAIFGCEKMPILKKCCGVFRFTNKRNIAWRLPFFLVVWEERIMLCRSCSSSNCPQRLEPRARLVLCCCYPKRGPRKKKLLHARQSNRHPNINESNEMTIKRETSHSLFGSVKERWKNWFTHLPWFVL